MTQPIHIPVFWDVDLTITKRYQQIPLFSHYKEKIAAKLKKQGFVYKQEESYWDSVNAHKDADAGVAYLQEIIWDAQPGGIFDGLTTDDLYNFGKEVEPATGFVECLKQLQKDFEGRAVLHHFFVSVGMRDIILGFIDKNNLRPYVAGVAASEFFVNEKKQLTGIRRVVSPFTKNEWIIGFMKGDQNLLNMQLKSNEYKYSYEDMIVIGDGLTDTSKFAYSKKKGGTPCAVYIPHDEKSFEKAKKTVGVWIDYLLPRDYTPGAITFELLKKIIEKKLARRCSFRPSALHDYKKGAIIHPDEFALIQKHIASCAECADYFTQTFVKPDGKVVTTQVLTPPKDQSKLSIYLE